MKCYNCPALRREYETGDKYCAIRNIDELKNGCHLSSKTIRKAIDECNKAQCEEYGRMVKFFNEVENERNCV